EENAADTQWILEIASDVHDEFTETVNTATIIIAEDFGSDSKIFLDVAKHFKNYRERIIVNNNSNNQVLIKKRLHMNTKTKRAPFGSFYENSVLTVTVILMNNMIEGENNDGDTRTVFKGIIKRI
ncbi:hypothetical protein CWI36_3095p0010, partial [Hamiltosporidium magnivora]